MRIKSTTCAIAASAALVLAACGGDDDDTSTGTTEGPGAQTTAEGAAGEAASIVGTGDTDLGQVLTDADGLTLYAFTPDEAGTPTCEGQCAEDWPPLAVDGDQLPAGLDASKFSVVERSDGTHQLAANDWPLYTFGGDSAPGDVNGQGMDDAWYAVDTDGALLRDADAGASDTTAADSGGDMGY